MDPVSGVESRGGDAGTPSYASEDWTESSKLENADDSSAEWLAKSRHFLILTRAGKPAWTRYGATHKLAPLCASLQTLLAVSETNLKDVFDPKSALQTVDAGGRRLVFLATPTVVYVASSALDEHENVLRGQLEYLKLAMTSLVTNAALETALTRNTKFDVGRALGAAERGELILGQTARDLSWDTSYVFDTYRTVAMPSSTRQTCALAVREALGGVPKPFAGLVFSGDGRVGAYAKPKRHYPVTISPKDIIVLMNFIRVMRRGDGDDDDAAKSGKASQREVFSRVCLPSFNPNGFMYAYVSCLGIAAPDTAADGNTENLGICWLTASPDAIEECRVARDALMKQLAEKDVAESLTLSALKTMHLSTSVSEALSGLPDASESLLHFVYNRPAREQHVSSTFSSAINRKDIKAIVRAYASMRASMNETKGVRETGGAQRVRYEQRSKFNILSCVGGDFEIYLVFKPTTSVTVAVGACNRLCVWLRVAEPELFVPSPPV